MPAASATARGAYESGAAAYKSGEYAKAEKYFQSALRQSPSDPNAHYGLAETLVALGQTERGMSEYEKTIKLAPKSKLADFARTGEQYVSEAQEKATLAKMAKLAQNTSLPAPTPPRYFAPEMPPMPSIAQSSIQTTSGGWSPLPAPTYPSYGPPSMGSSSYGSSYSRRHGRRYGWGNGGYSNYAGYSYFRDYHVPQMQVSTYGYAPPLNVVTKPEPVPEVELLAKQQRLVIDEKTSH